MAIRPPSAFSIAAGVYGFRTVMVNYYFVRVDRGNWVLIDAGLPFSGRRLQREAAIRFGSNRPPLAIVLTHGHFDHVGALTRLQRVWPDVPVYAHAREVPFLIGSAAYAKADPTVGGGIMPWTAVLYPRRVGPFANVVPLSVGGTIPELPQWRWLETPGHSPGHVSLFRDDDATLISGDAVITTRQESALAIMRQTREVRPPPAYFTPDWQGAYDSILRVRALRPNVIGSGHGMPAGGQFLREGLELLVREFETRGLPRRGRYVPSVLHAVSA